MEPRRGDLVGAGVLFLVMVVFVVLVVLAALPG